MSDTIEQIPSGQSTPVKPVVARKPAKKKAKANKERKRDSHAGRPKASFSYVVDGLKAEKFKGTSLQWAIEQVKEHERKQGQPVHNRPLVNEDGSITNAGVLAATVKGKRIKLEDVDAEDSEPDPALRAVAQLKVTHRHDSGMSTASD